MGHCMSQREAIEKAQLFWESPSLKKLGKRSTFEKSYDVGFIYRGKRSIITEEELWAARKILNAYRRYKSRKEMGACFSNKQTVRSVESAFQGYPRQVKINIKKSSANKKLMIDEISCKLTEALILESQEVELENSCFWVSSCVLPGMDPRGIEQKECQDLCFYIVKPRALLLVLFDGHGEQGKDLVEYCKKVVETYYEENFGLERPEELLTNMTLKCDSRVKLPINNIDAYFSGTTAVFVMITSGAVYTASVGDSRAILATTEMPPVAPFPEIHLEEAKTRTITDLKIQLPLEPVQLTRDQKPEDPDEYERIIKSGGRVQRLEKDDGSKIGPYRVWQFHEDTPGLAMSRSIGDQIGSYIGVIANPLTSTFKLRVRDDYFLVIASDGIWDVFSNQEVVNFVEHYRGVCTRERRMNLEGCVNSSNASVAELLCEEARQRWFRIVEEEDVVIDDISCLVLELKGEEKEVEKKLGKNRMMEVTESNDELFKAPTMRDTKIEDPIRSSMII